MESDSLKYAVVVEEHLSEGDLIENAGGGDVRQWVPHTGLAEHQS